MLIHRDIKIPASSFFLFGVRCMEKSIFVRTLIDKETLYIDFLSA
ncbi:MAG: hypothetical protein ACUVTX_08645 [Bacteroidales bacterium]